MRCSRQVAEGCFSSGSTVAVRLRVTGKRKRCETGCLGGARAAG